jgi:hypothetical protein
MSMGSPPLSIAAVLDAATNRDLLSDPRPLTLAGNAPAALQVMNSLAGSLQITIAADQPWLRMVPTELTLAPGAMGAVVVTAASDGTDEFALLELRWQEAGETLAESILVQRQRRSAPAATAPTQPPPPPPPPADAGALPDWMR